MFLTSRLSLGMADGVKNTAKKTQLNATQVTTFTRRGRLLKNLTIRHIMGYWVPFITCKLSFILLFEQQGIRDELHLELCSLRGEISVSVCVFVLQF